MAPVTYRSLYYLLAYYLLVSLASCVVQQSADKASAAAAGGTLLPQLPVPPGGLIPYRHGQLWGYADTTGRIVIAPCFAREPRLFLFGFGQLEPTDADGYVTFINAAGQTLKSDDAHCLIFTADSSLQRVPRRDYYLSPTIHRFGIEESGAVVRTALFPPPGWQIAAMEVLGAQRSAIRRYQAGLPAKALVLAPQLLRFALVDEHSRALTTFSYSRIHLFQEGFARFERDGGEGLMNRQGKEIYFSPQGSVSDMHRGRALVWVPGRVEALGQRAATTSSAAFFAGIIDTTGRLQYPLRPQVRYYWLIPGRIVVAQSGRSPQDVYRLLTPQEQPLLNGQRLQQPYLDRATQRLLVTGLHGEAGLLDTALHWIIPFQRQQLYLDGQQESNRTSLAMERQGRHGLVAWQDGRVLVPLRYDTIYATLHGGLAEVGQQGRHLLVNYQGRELASGWLQPFSLATNTQRGLRVWRVRDAQYALDQDALLLDSVGHAYEPTEFTYCPQVVGPGLLLRNTRGRSQQGVYSVTGREVIPLRYQRIEWQRGFLVAERAGVDDQLKTTQLSDVYTPSGQLVCSLPYPPTVMPRGWIHLGGATLRSPTGQVVRLPARLLWNEKSENDFAWAGAYPFQFGVVRVGSQVQLTTVGGGYVTRGGRQLWQD